MATQCSVSPARPALCSLTQIVLKSSRSHSQFPGVPEVVGVTGEVESSCSVNYHVLDLNVDGQSSTLIIICTLWWQAIEHHSLHVTGRPTPTLPLPMSFVTSFGNLLEPMAINMTPWPLALALLSEELGT